MIYCQYCGTKHIIDKTVVEHRGGVHLYGLASADSLLDRAFILISNGKFEKADNCLDRVLDITPKRSRAYLGALLCELQIRDENSLAFYGKPIDDNNNFQNALKFAEDDEKQFLLSSSEAIKQGIRKKETGFEERIRELRSEIEDLENRRIFKYDYSRLRSINSIPSLPFIIVPSVLLFLWNKTKSTVLLILMLLALAVGIGFLYLLIGRIPSLIKQYENSLDELEAKQHELEECKADFDKWKEYLYSE